MLPQKVIYVRTKSGQVEPSQTLRFTEDSWERFFSDWRCCKNTGSPRSGVYLVALDGDFEDRTLDLESIAFVM